MVLCKFGPAVTVGPKFVTTPLAMSQHADTALRNCPRNVATIQKRTSKEVGLNPSDTAHRVSAFEGTSAVLAAQDEYRID